MYWTNSYQNKNGSSGLQMFTFAVVLHDPDGAEGREAEEEAVHEGPAMADAEEGGTGRDVAQDHQQT